MSEISIASDYQKKKKIRKLHYMKKTDILYQD